MRHLTGYFPCHWVILIDFYKGDSNDFIIK